ncbi:MAG: CoA transferase [Candidatus Thermoplasmatota archaeon]|nr:CoA transferase [Candidatus Thermoplasmatota archaeon]
MKLEGIKILDMTRLIPGPYATMLLADLGAEVIKIEDPETGDYARDMEPSIGGEGAPFLMLNRNKKAIEVDLKKEEGKEIFMKLVEDADVVFEQFRPGVVEKLKVDYDSVREVNPDIIYCSLSSYGQTGPSKDKGGHDLNYASEGGLIDLTRSKDGKPAIPGFPISVMTAGLFSAFSIINALLDRELNDSGGEYIDISVLDCLISFSTGIAWQPLLKEETPRARETELTGRYPFYDIYETKDGRYFALAAYEEKYWKNFCKLIGREELKDQQFSEKKESIRKIIEEEFKKKSFEEWKKISKENEVMISPVNNLKEVFESQHVEERDLIGSLDFSEIEIDQIGFPAGSNKNIDEFRTSPPQKGEHTQEILKEAGYTEEEIERFEDLGVM